MSETSKPKKGWRILLIVSLAINLLILGIMIGGFMHGKSMRPPGGLDFALGPAAAALIPQDRRAIRAALRKHPDLVPFRPGARNDSMTAYIEGLRQEPFNIAVIEAIFAEQRMRADNTIAVVQSVMLEHFMQMTFEERSAYADRFEDGIRQRPHGPSKRNR